MNPESDLSIPNSEINDSSPTSANPNSAAVTVDSNMNRDHVNNSQLLASTEHNQEDPGFISEQLSLEISKAQESLAFMTSYHSASEDEHEDEDTPSSLKQTAAKTNAELNKINMTQIDVNAANNIITNELEISSTGSLEQSFQACLDQSTDSITTATTDLSNPTNLTPISDGCEFHECNMASITPSQIKSPISLLPSKRSLSPTISKEARNLRSKLEISRTPSVANQETEVSLNEVDSVNSANSTHCLSNLGPENSQDAILNNLDLPNIPTAHISLSLDSNNPQVLDVAAQSHHEQRLSPANSNRTGHIQMVTKGEDTSIQMNESELESKPLWASSALPVYSKLIAALEEARMSDCLTEPMAKELLHLTLRCKRTGNAIISRKPLPPEDKVIVLLDDEDEDLASKYGFPSEIFNCQDPDQEEPIDLAVTIGNIAPPDQTLLPGLTSSFDGVKSATNPPSQLPDLGDKGDETESISIATHFQTANLTATAPIFTESQPAMDTSCLSDQSDPAQEPSKNSTQLLRLEVDLHEIQSTNLEQPVKSSTAIPLLSIESQPSTEKSKSLQSVQAQQSNNDLDAIHSQPSEAQETMDKLTSADGQSSPSQTQLESTSILSSPPPSPQQTIVPSQTQNSTEALQTPVDPLQSESKGKSSRDWRPRRKTAVAVVIPRFQESNKRHTPPPITYQRNEKKSKAKDVEPTSKNDTATEGRNDTTDDGTLGHVKFFLGPALMEKELTKLLTPYNGNQTSKVAKLAAWNALTNLLKLRREGEPLSQVFLDSIEGGINSVMVKTKYNGQTWYNAIEETMPHLFNCHRGEPAYAADLFNTLHLKNQNMSDKIPPGLPAVWNHTWKTMRMCIRPSPSRVSSFLKVLLDSVLLTGKTFLKEPPVSESEKAKTGIEAVCQAIKWLNSQRNSKPENSRTIRLLDSTKVNSVIDIGLIQQWEDIFIKVLDSYVVQYFEANYILNDEASTEDKALAIRFKKEWKGDSIKSPTLSHLTMFACCGIRGLICCSSDVNVTPAGQMLGFTILSDWLVKQRPDFQVKEPIFKRSNQMLMKLIDGLFDQQGHFVRPEITWYDVAKNLCFDYLSYWFTEAGELAEGGNLVFPKSSAFVGKDQVVRFSESF
ncbi:hypothetical protein DFH28DRAFT_1079335 [Melampsora americana]|nr:hypothetical protein DFH28DRAFT_1079335 [Melampsora americana]